jgi:hypothetical protein
LENVLLTVTSLLPQAVKNRAITDARMILLVFLDADILSSKKTFYFRF